MCAFSWNKKPSKVLSKHIRMQLRAFILPKYSGVANPLTPPSLLEWQSDSRHSPWIGHVLPRKKPTIYIVSHSIFVQAVCVGEGGDRIHINMSCIVYYSLSFCVNIVKVTDTLNQKKCVNKLKNISVPNQIKHFIYFTRYIVLMHFNRREK